MPDLARAHSLHVGSTPLYQAKPGKAGLAEQRLVTAQPLPCIRHNLVEQNHNCYYITLNHNLFCADPPFWWTWPEPEPEPGLELVSLEPEPET